MSLNENMEDWDAYRKMARKESLKPTLATHEFIGDRLVLVPFGDLHTGSKHFDEELAREAVDWCVDEGAFVLGMGDMLESATRDSVGSGVYDQTEILQVQMQHLYDILQPLVDKDLLLGMHPGNHELRVYKSSGVDITKIMCRELGVPYLGWGKLHRFKVNDQAYTLYSTHGSSGARLPHTKMKGCLDLANLVDAEIYCMGHLHQLAHHVRNFYTPNSRSKKVDEKQKHFLLCGSYLSHWGSYGHVKSYEPMRKGSPKIKLAGDKHQIRVSL